MAFGIVLLVLACFLSGALHVLWSRREGVPSVPPPRLRRTLQLGTVTCDVVEFKDFELIKTSEHILHTVGW